MNKEITDNDSSDTNSKTSTKSKNKLLKKEIDTKNKDDKKTKTYPKSDLGYQCIDKCYPPMSKFTHPYLNKDGQEMFFSVKNLPTCPIKPTKTITGNIIYADNCTTASVEIFDEPDAVDPNLTTKIMNFNVSDFLKKGYNVKNLEDVVLWRNEHQSASERTLIRLINLSIREYAPEYIKSISLYRSGQIFERKFIELLKTIVFKWVIEKYVHKLKSSSKSDNSENNKKTEKKILNIITYEFISNNFYNFVKKYYSELTNKNKEFTYPLNNFQEYIYKKILKEIDLEILEDTKST